MIKIDSNFRIKQLTTVAEIARLINDSDAIARQDIIYALGSKMVKPLKSIENTKTFKVYKLAGLSNRRLKVYSTNRPTFETVLANHYKALAMYSLREYGAKISHPVVLENNSWGLNLVIGESSVISLETILINSKNYTKLKGKYVGEKQTPLYIFENQELFNKVKDEGLVYGESICIVLGNANSDLYVMNYLGITEKFKSLKQIVQFKNVKQDSVGLVNSILKSYDTSKFIKRKKDDK